MNIEDILRDIDSAVLDLYDPTPDKKKELEDIEEKIKESRNQYESITNDISIKKQLLKEVNETLNRTDPQKLILLKNAVKNMSDLKERLEKEVVMSKKIIAKNIRYNKNLVNRNMALQKQLHF